MILSRVSSRNLPRKIPDGCRYYSKKTDGLQLYVGDHVVLCAGGDQFARVEIPHAARLNMYSSYPSGAKEELVLGRVGA